MTRSHASSQSGPPGDPAQQPRAARVPRALWTAAAKRLIAAAQPNRSRAAAQLVESAERHGIDLALLWGVVDPHGRAVRDVALVVPGAGATGMMFLSGPEAGVSGPDPAARVACIRAALAECNTGRAERIKIVQALPEPEESWAIQAYELAGMTGLGVLRYLRRRAQASDAAAPPPSWPEGVTVRPLASLERRDDWRRLSAALDASYVDTADCPELCGLRETGDIIESHRAAGVFDPRMWWIVEKAGEPLGCLLQSRSPDFGTVELVYIGLAPELRGGGLGRRLLSFGLSQAARLAPSHDMTCAVDARNAAAVKLYEDFAFAEFAARRPFIQPV